MCKTTTYYYMLK